MKKTGYIVTILALATGCATMQSQFPTTPAPGAMVESMTEFSAAISKVLPEGWAVEQTPIERESPAGSSKFGYYICAQPHIVVYRKEPIHGYFDGVSIVLPKEPLVLVQQYRLAPLLSPDKHLRLKAENQRKQRVREEYRSKLAHLKGLTLKSSNHDPKNYKPVSPEDLRMRMEYEFAYLITIPEDIPSHHFRNLSIFPDTHRNFVFRDPDVEHEYRRVEQLILAILTAYE